MKNILNRKSALNALVYVMSFFISAVGMILIIKARGFYPFKQATMLVMDMRDQYMEFYASLRYLFTEGNSLFFNWSRSMGGNFLGLFAYYTANPLSFLTVLFPIEQMPLAVAVLSVIKIGFCGLSFSMYAVYLWQRQERGFYFGRLVVVPLAVSYALMSYNITYLLCLMWLDGVMFLPWVLLGVEKILDGKKGFSYLLALTGLFYCNYYTGYMVGIFTAIYILYRMAVTFDLSSKRKAWREAFGKLLRFTAVTLLSLGLSAPLLLSVIRDLMTGKLDALARETDRIYNFEPFSKFFGQFRNGVYTDLNYVGLPSVYCGYLVLACAVLFFFVKKVNFREKAGALLILIFLAGSFYFVSLDKAWHGFQLPTCFPYRYAFLFSFVLLYMALRMLNNIPWEKLPKFWNKDLLYGFVLTVFMAVTAWDMGVNGRDILFAIGNHFAYTSLEDYQTFLESTQPLVDSIKEQDDGLYRINQCYEFSKNDAMLFGYNGMTHYSSTYNRSVNVLTKQLGLAQIHFWNSGYGSNLLLDSLFGVKYVLGENAVPPLYVRLFDTGVLWEEDFETTASYENPFALSFVYSAPLTNLTPDLGNASPFVNQNAFLNAVAGTQEDYYTEYDCQAQRGESGFCYTFTADSDNPVYLYLETDECYLYGPRKVLVNGKSVGGYFTSETICALYLGCFASGQEIVVEIPQQDMEAKQVFAVQLHMETLVPVLEELQKKGMNVKNHRGGKLEGSISVSGEEMIVTSIPYDLGWHIKLDGKSVKPVSFADTFLAIPAENGEHTLCLTYRSPGFDSGLAVLFAAAVMSGLYFVGCPSKLSGPVA